jgi:hypothetical protein
LISPAKDTKLNERINMQFRADIFNLFNHPTSLESTLPNFLATQKQRHLAPELHDQNVTANDQSLGLPCCGPTLPATIAPDVAIGYPFLGGVVRATFNWRRSLRFEQAHIAYKGRALSPCHCFTAAELTRIC